MDRFNRSLTSTEYLQQANSALTVAVQIETKEALEVVDAIAAIDGIDILFVGPFDLGNNIGYPVLNGILDESLQVAIQKILDAAVAAGKEAGIFCSSAVQARAYAEMGFHMINLTTDVGALTARLSSELATFSGDIEPGVAKAGPYGSR